MNFMSPSTRLDGAQKSSTFFVGLAGSATRSGFSPSMTQMAAITIFTFSGGDFMVFTDAMSAGEMVSSACRAASSAGIATARSSAHSFFTAATFSASAFAMAASREMTARVSSTPGSRASITFISSAVSRWLCCSDGCSAFSSRCISFTCSVANSSLSRPVR